MRITIEQQDEIIERLSKAEAILDCLSVALNPSAVIKVEQETINNTVWALTDLIHEANQIAINKGAENENQ